MKQAYFTFLGKCLCRYGIHSGRCTNVTKDRFFPKYDYFLYEAEYQSGDYNVTSNVSEYNTQFTGGGYALIQKKQHIQFKISVQVKSNYQVVFRYCDAIGVVGVSIRGNISLECDQVNQNMSVRRLNSDTCGASWQLFESIPLCPGVNYTIDMKAVDLNSSVKVDSLLLLPDLTPLRSYQELVVRCLENATTIQGSEASLAQCRNVTFSTMVEFFNGSLGVGSFAIFNHSLEINGFQCCIVKISRFRQNSSAINLALNEW